MFSQAASVSWVPLLADGAVRHLPFDFSTYSPLDCRVHSWLVAPAHFPRTAVVAPVTHSLTTSSSLFAAKVMFCAAPAVQVQMTILLPTVVLPL